ncbi:MAG: methionine adenosyltransferase domain-containing protein [Nanoarchaeota archaeon]
MTEIIHHAFEVGRMGKPDEFDSIIASYLAAHLLEINRKARFDLRVSGTERKGKPHVRLSGEVSDFILQRRNLEGEMAKIALDTYNLIHNSSLSPRQLEVSFNFKPQSTNLASNRSAGDSGNPIAVAYKDSPNNLPWERFLAVDIRDVIDGIYRNNGKVPSYLAKSSGVKELKDLRADGKIGVEVGYEGAKIIGVEKITIAAEHENSLRLSELRDKLSAIVDSRLGILSTQYGLNGHLKTDRIIVNGAGAWHRGGWGVDEGSREAKPYRDGFGSYGVAEDSFSGEDPSKPSGTGTFLARNIALLAVNKYGADFARVALSYAIGDDRVGLNIVTNGTGRLPQKELEERIRGEMGLTIGDAVNRFNLRRPSLYRAIAKNADFFHNHRLPWNRINTN